jgi:hypothetical protein
MTHPDFPFKSVGRVATAANGDYDLQERIVNLQEPSCALQESYRS